MPLNNGNRRQSGVIQQASNDITTAEFEARAQQIAQQLRAVTNQNTEVSPIEPVAEVNDILEETPLTVENITTRIFSTSSRTFRSIFSGSDPIIEQTLTEKSKVQKDDIVTTISGKKLKASECIFSRGEFFEKTHPDIVKCSFTNKLIHIRDTNNVIIGIKINGDTYDITWGKVHLNFIEFLPFLYSAKYGIDSRILNEDLIDKLLFKQATDQDCFLDISRKQNDMHKSRYYPSFKNKSKLVIKDIKDEIKFGIKSPTNSIAEGLPYTMGVEIEVSHGFIPQYKSYLNYNLSCIRDGSINGGDGGPEYVTGILKGDSGFKHLQDICLALKDCKVNHTCGVHVHVGNIDFTKQFLVNSYVLALLIEDELFTFLPKSRRNNRYCRKLKPLSLKVALDNSKENVELEANYNKLFKYISYGKVNNPNFEYNKNKQHPMGAKCGYNHDTPRYCWLNYVPAMFNTRGNGSYSLEIRNHSGTTNFIKIRNWILLFMAIVAFAERHPDLIKPGITISDILDKIYPRKANSLKLYFKTRQSKFSDEGEDIDLPEETTHKTIKELIKE